MNNNSPIPSSIPLLIIHQAAEWDTRRVLEAAMAWNSKIYPLPKNSCPELEHIPKPISRGPRSKWYDVVLPISPDKRYIVSKADHQFYSKINGIWQIDDDNIRPTYLHRCDIQRGNSPCLLYLHFIWDDFVEKQDFYMEYHHLLNSLAGPRTVEWRKCRGDQMQMTVIGNTILFGAEY